MFNWLKKALSSNNVAGNAAVPTATQTDKRDALNECAVYKKRGNEYLSQGRLDEAAECYRQAVDIDPGFAEGHLNLGFALHGLRRFEEAKEHLKQAIQINPKMEDAYYLLGAIAQEQGHLDSAIQNFHKAIKLKPDFEIVYRDLCQCLLQTGNNEAARHILEEGIAVNPDSVDFHFYLGNLFASEKEPAKAITHYKRIIAIQADNAEVLCLMGNAYRDNDELSEAIGCYRKALILQPSLVEAHDGLGSTFKKMGNLDEAMTCYRAALEIQPDSATANNNLGVILKEMGKLDEAATCYRKALAIRPDFSESMNNLGNVLKMQGKWDDAIACYHKALSLKPDLAMTHNNLGVIFFDQFKLDQASACFRRVLELSPDFHQARINLLHILQHECEWKDLAAGSAEVRRAIRDLPPTLENRIAPFSFMALPGTTPQEQLICANKWVQGEYQAQISNRPKMGFQFKRERKPKIHVGYFSGDFRKHPVAQLMAEVFELHDRTHFRISAYSYGIDDGSAIRRRLEKGFDNFVDMQDLSDEDIANRIYRDQTDILVDLSGYTHNSRSGILALRPAPIQVSYIGYLGTMGGDFMDYIIADPFLIPPEDRDFYSEKVAYLPFYQANDRQCVIAEPPSRKACGLPEHSVVFCCFNQTYKILPDVFSVWMQLLTEIQGSVLWLYASNPKAVENLRRHAEAKGVAAERLIFAETLPLDQHLARLKCADLFLDTLPYNAGTTASNALWAGVPVITCTGETFSSRMAGSLLMAMNLPELITDNLRSYYALAHDLAKDRNRREMLREKIIANRDTAPLFDSQVFTRNLEAAYIRMRNDYLVSEVNY